MGKILNLSTTLPALVRARHLEALEKMRPFEFSSLRIFPALVIIKFNCLACMILSGLFSTQKPGCAAPWRSALRGSRHTQEGRDGGYPDLSSPGHSRFSGSPSCAGFQEGLHGVGSVAMHLFITPRHNVRCGGAWSACCARGQAKSHALAAASPAAPPCSPHSCRCACAYIRCVQCVWCVRRGRCGHVSACAVPVSACAAQTCTCTARVSMCDACAKARAHHMVPHDLVTYWSSGSCSSVSECLVTSTSQRHACLAPSAAFIRARQRRWRRETWHRSASLWSYGLYSYGPI